MEGDDVHTSINVYNMHVVDVIGYLSLREYFSTYLC